MMKEVHDTWYQPSENFIYRRLTQCMTGLMPSKHIVFINQTKQPLMRKLFSSKPIMQDGGIAFLRIVTGIFLVYHGWEIFNTAQIKEYAGWDMFKNSANPMLLPYIGKGLELVGGMMLVLGLLTRVACIITAVNMAAIAFYVGHGKIWYDDQYPFLFVMLAAVFFFTGPGCWSVDKVLFDKNERV